MDGHQSQNEIQCSTIQIGFGHGLDRLAMCQISNSTGRYFRQALDLFTPKVRITQQPGKQSNLGGGDTSVVWIGTVGYLHRHAVETLLPACPLSCTGEYPNFRENARENAAALPKPTVPAADLTLRPERRAARPKFRRQPFR